MLTLERRAQWVVGHDGDAYFVLLKNDRDAVKNMLLHRTTLMEDYLNSAPVGQVNNTPRRRVVVRYGLRATRRPTSRLPARSGRSITASVSDCMFLLACETNQRATQRRQQLQRQRE